jgi:hypothetical protein
MTDQQMETLRHLKAAFPLEAMTVTAVQAGPQGKIWIVRILQSFVFEQETFINLGPVS